MASAEAQKAKDRGNAAFKAGNYAEAVGNYTAAILADRNDPTYPLNRAAAYLKLGKYEDAERDCSTVLDLMPRHVKALYRRAQARSELGNLSPAQKDLAEALRLEPANVAVKTELEKINKLIKKPKAPSKPTIDLAPPKRRRLPIEVVEPVASTSTSTSTSIPTLPTAVLELISSPSPTVKKADSTPKPLSFPSRETPQVRSSSDAEHTAAVSSKAEETPKSTPNARGGIFRPSGEHTIFRPPTSQVNGFSTGKLKVFSTEDEDGHSSPISLFEFTRSWELASPSERWDLICKIPPQALPSFFKTSLEAPLLMSIVEVFSLAVSSTGDSAIKKRVQEYLNHLSKVSRFNTVTMFMNRQEKELCKMLIDSVGGVSAWRV